MCLTLGHGFYLSESYRGNVVPECERRVGTVRGLSCLKRISTKGYGVDEFPRILYVSALAS